MKECYNTCSYYDSNYVDEFNILSALMDEDDISLCDKYFEYTDQYYIQMEIVLENVTLFNHNTGTIHYDEIAINTSDYLDGYLVASMLKYIDMYELQLFLNKFTFKHIKMETLENMYKLAIQDVDKLKVYLKLNLSTDEFEDILSAMELDKLPTPK